MRTATLLLASLLVLLHTILPGTVDSLALGGGREEHRQGCGGRRIRNRVDLKSAWPDRRGRLNSAGIFWEVAVPKGVQRRNPGTEEVEEVAEDASDAERVQYNPNAWSRFGRSCP